MGPIKFAPWLRTMVWGGNKISKYKNLCEEVDQIGESWEISAVEGHESVVTEGLFKGKTLPGLSKVIWSAKRYTKTTEIASRC